MPNPNLQGLSLERFRRILHSQGYETIPFEGTKRENAAIISVKHKTAPSPSFAAGVVGPLGDGTTYLTGFFLIGFVQTRSLDYINKLNRNPQVVRFMRVFTRRDDKGRDIVQVEMDFVAVGLSDESIVAQLECWMVWLHDLGREFFKE
jgi:hypothetical protein